MLLLRPLLAAASRVAVPFRPLFLLIACAWLLAGTAQASTFTPLEWQGLLGKSPDPAMAGQRKHLTWVRDQNRNFIDDAIEKRFRPGDALSVVVDLNHSMTTKQIAGTFGQYGTIDYVSRTVSAVYLSDVKYDVLKALAALPDVAMIEWQAPFNPQMDTAARAMQVLPSNTYPGYVPAHGLDGTGVVVAIVGTGITSATFLTIRGKRVAGFDASNVNDPGDGSTDPADILSYHESIMAGMIVGGPPQPTGAPSGIPCRAPTDGTSDTWTCQGIAKGARYVNVRVCNGNSTSTNCQGAFVARALDWIAANHETFHINVVNMSLSQSCVTDDGTSTEAEQANYLVGLGMVVVASAEHSATFTCDNGSVTVATGQPWITAPGSASGAIQVTASDDKGTITRGDDSHWSNYISGPRSDFDPAVPDVTALKPDIAAPGQGLAVYRGGTTVISGISGTSPATALVSGAAALLLQQFNNQINPESLKLLLLTNADSSGNVPYNAQPGPWGDWDATLGAGLVSLGADVPRGSDVMFTNCTTGGNVGSPCNLANGAPFWDNEVDITTSTAPMAGVQTMITVTIRNNGSVPASNVQVSFGVYDYSASNPLFYHVGTQVVPYDIPPNTTITVQQPWTPLLDSHQCIQVSIASASDGDYVNNVTQRNFSVGGPRFRVRIDNWFLKRTHFVVKHKPSIEGWVCSVNKEEFDLEDDAPPYDLQVTFDAPPGAKPGQSATCQVGVYATPGGEKSRLVGGVTAQRIAPRR